MDGSVLHLHMWLLNPQLVANKTEKGNFYLFFLINLNSHILLAAITTRQSRTRASVQPLPLHGPSQPSCRWLFLTLTAQFKVSSSKRPFLTAAPKLAPADTLYYLILFISSKHTHYCLYNLSSLNENIKSMEVGTLPIPFSATSPTMYVRQTVLSINLQ